MSKARRTEGPCAPLFYCVLVAAAWSSAPAWSQSVDLVDLEACAALPADDQKIACINAIIAAERDESTQAVPDAQTPANPSAPAAAEAPVASSEAVAGAVPAAEPARAGPAIALPAPTATRAAVIPVAAVPADEPAPSPPAPVAAPRADIAQSAASSTPAPVDEASAAFGSEQLQQADDRRPEFVENTVVDVSRANNKALIFHMADGQVWRQIEPRRYPYPKNGEFAVTISQGMMGEYRMRIGNNGRMVRIRRIK